VALILAVTIFCVTDVTGKTGGVDHRIPEYQFR